MRLRTPLVVVLLLALLPLTYYAGYRSSRRSAAAASASAGRRVLYYVDPMNASFRADKPGIAPCGMPLQPVYADGQPVASSPTAVAVPAERQQLIGLKLGSVTRGVTRQTLRLLGRVAVDEARLYRLNAVTGGWIRETGTATTGSLVRRGEVLAAYYAPELATPLQNFIYTVETYEKIRQTGSNPHDNLQGGGQLAAYERNIAAGRQTLLNLGMSPEQLERVRSSRQFAWLVEIRAPASGLVLARNVANGQRFDPSTELFTIADLGRVWILADAPDDDARRLAAGTRATLTIPGSATTLVGRVSAVPPRFDAATRTMKVRLEADNPGYVLRPDMFVDVELPVNAAPALTVAKEAVIDSGTRRVVYVQAQPGVFEPRRVETGWREGDRVEIVSGLSEGDTVVVSGNFLLDSESRMRAAASEEAQSAGAPVRLAKAERDPVCGMDVDAGQARASGRVSTRDGRTYFFCSPACKKAFDAGPGAHVEAAGVARR